MFFSVRPKLEPCWFCKRLPTVDSDHVRCDTIVRRGDEQDLCDHGRKYGTPSEWNEQHLALQNVGVR